MARSANAQLAVNLYEEIRIARELTPANAWLGIAELLLTCEVWAMGWRPFHDVVVYRESNDFKENRSGPGAVLQRAEKLTSYLAEELGVDRENLCTSIGRYYRHPRMALIQPHNPVGHAFRSILVHVLETYGDKDITYSEEVDPHAEFPGQSFATRSKNPRIDIVARRGNHTVALISSKWRFRHDRTEMVDEAIAYAPAAKRHNPSCRMICYVGEFSPPRLEKVLEHTPPIDPRGVFSSIVHFAPELLWKGLGENGRTQHLQGLEWLVTESYKWK